MRKALVGGVLVIVIVFLWAVWDGGEEPIRPIDQEIPMPEQWR